ncbi:riboflavin synthase [Gryllotalpicola reticulitermitis]|uniref:Riboflavin synthase n=1 Tax=Gryllotalpicola reticulitermitis TaxID=1184153 RepID=A0ABV8Q7X5_9MICO
MFTGIIEEIGEITRVERHADAARLTVRGPIAVADAKHGDSIAVSGVCLTVVGLERDEFTADVMQETLAMSTLADAAIGTHVNLERAAQLGDRLGGHIVQGHVDGTAEVLATNDGSAWRVVRFALAPELAPLVARKGSIAIDGTSLTVSAVGGGSGAGTDDEGTGRAGGFWFEVSLIPETLAATTLGQRRAGDRVNIETDILARHVERMLEFRGAETTTSEEAHA